MIDPSPPGNGTGARQGADPQIQNNDTQQLADSAPNVNRALIKTQSVFKLHEVQERRRKFHDEITDGTRTRVFPRLWSAFLKFDRLVAAEKRSAQQ